jgi:hypothetical protein
MRTKPGARKPQTIGESIIEGLEQAIAWTRAENRNVRVTLVSVPSKSNSGHE